MTPDYGPWKDSGVSGLWQTVGYDDFGRPKQVRNEKLHIRLTFERVRNRVLCEQWRNAAVADGWSIEPTYEHEPQEHAFRLRRDGFVVQGLARPIPGPHGTTPAPQISIWGPDGLAIDPPETYDIEKIRRGAETCGSCGAYPVKTERVAFVNRCCAACAPDQRARLETPGWAE